jgi:hypothetical protein
MKKLKIGLPIGPGKVMAGHDTDVTSIVIIVCE